jgi:hypothetical protein
MNFSFELKSFEVKVLYDLASFKTLKCQGIPIKSIDVDPSERLRTVLDVLSPKHFDCFGPELASMKWRWCTINR